MNPLNEKPLSVSPSLYNGVPFKQKIKMKQTNQQKTILTLGDLILLIGLLGK